MKAIYLLLLIGLFTQPQDKQVYICTSTGAYAHHKQRTCEKLQQCRSEIKEVSLSQAHQQGKQKPCGWCWH